MRGFRAHLSLFASRREGRFRRSEELIVSASSDWSFWPIHCDSLGKKCGPSESKLHSIPAILCATTI